MAGSLNEVTLIGNLGGDPDVKALQNGNKVANFSVATSEQWRDKTSGEKKEHTEWHRVVVWQEGLVKVIEQYLHKGDKVMVRGQLKTRKWQDQSGQERYSTEVVLQGFDCKLVMLSTRGDGGASGGGSSSSQQQAPQQRQAASTDDEIPF